MNWPHVSTRKVYSAHCAVGEKERYRELSHPPPFTPLIPKHTHAYTCLLWKFDATDMGYLFSGENLKFWSPDGGREMVLLQPWPQNVNWDSTAAFHQNVLWAASSVLSILTRRPDFCLPQCSMWDSWTDRCEMPGGLGFHSRLLPLKFGIAVLSTAAQKYTDFIYLFTFFFVVKDIYLGWGKNIIWSCEKYLYFSSSAAGKVLV